MFYVIPTPIGNIKDITLRAIDTFKICDYLLCENIKTTQFLLNYFDIKKPCLKYNSYSSKKLEDKIIYDLKQNKNIGLASEAGTPGISDPGNKIINKIIELNLPITCLPGPNAVIPSIVLSGFNTKEFIFLGFLPHKGRNAVYKYISLSDKNIVFFESVYRVSKTLNELSNFLDKNRRISIIRELSKVHETIYRGTIDDFIQKKINIVLKGEFVFVIERK